MNKFQLIANLIEREKQLFKIAMHYNLNNC